jgi:hypothetical protein
VIKKGFIPWLVVFAVKLGKPSELYDMVHTENFVLVDAKKEFVVL